MKKRNRKTGGESLVDWSPDPADHWEPELDLWEPLSDWEPIAEDWGDLDFDLWEPGDLLTWSPELDLWEPGGEAGKDWE